MPQCAGDSISSLSCLSDSFLQQALLRNTPIASSPQQVVPSVQCTSNLSPEVSKAVFRLKNQGIQVTPKLVHQVKKKEAWKSKRRERKEHEKAGRVTEPVWYDWPEEQAALEKRRLSFAQTEEDEADEFLSFVAEARPMKRIVVDDVDNASMRTSKRSPRLQKRGTRVQKWRRRTEYELKHGYSTGNNRAIWFDKQSVAPAGGLNCKMNIKRILSPPQHCASETLYPWGGNHVWKTSEALKELHKVEPDFAEQEDNPGFTETNNGLRHTLSNANEHFSRPESQVQSSRLQGIYDIDRHTDYIDHVLDGDTSSDSHPHTITNVSTAHLPRPMVAYEQDLTLESFDKQHQHLGNIDSKHSSVLKELYNTEKESPTAGIEKFLDDEIQEMPKKPDIWMQGVGLVKQRKPPFSREIKERILARRRGDWSLLYEEGDTEDELDDLTVPFDGREALREDRKIQRLAARLHEINYWTSKIHFSRLMHSGRMKLTADRVLRIVQILGENGNWRRAMQVVQWVHKRQHYQFHASKFVLTTLLSVLGKARRPVEAMKVFNVMRETFSSYPDMAAYHAMACILGQAGQLRELLHLMESLEAGPPQPIKFIPSPNWDPALYPDIVVYNAVLTACISTKEWAGVSWTWEEIEKKGIKPNGATFGLTIEAMVKANNFDQVVRFYKRMERAGFPPNAQTYTSLVEAFGQEKMTDEALALVKEMEASGIIGSASVYFSLACSFCIGGKLKEALVQVRRMKELSSCKPDVITYTGLIQTCHKVGRIQDAIFLFKHMQHTCAPNVRTCNEMIKLYGWNDMFEEAKNVYESVKKGKLDSCLVYDDTTRLSRDSFTFELMLKAAVVSEKWDYFDEIYWDMTLQGYNLIGKTNQWLLLKVARQKKVDVAADMLQRLRKSGEIAHLRFYEALILSCIQAKKFHDALIYFNDMRIDGYEVVPTILDLQKQIGKETWDSFLHMANGSQVFNIIREDLCYGMLQQASKHKVE